MRTESFKWFFWWSEYFLIILKVLKDFIFSKISSLLLLSAILFSNPKISWQCYFCNEGIIDDFSLSSFLFSFFSFTVHIKRFPDKIILKIYHVTWNNFLKEWYVSTEDQSKHLKQDRNSLESWLQIWALKTNYLGSYPSSVWHNKTQYNTCCCWQLGKWLRCTNFSISTTCVEKLASLLLQLWLSSDDWSSLTPVFSRVKGI